MLAPQIAHKNGGENGGKPNLKMLHHAGRLPNRREKRENWKTVRLKVLRHVGKLFNLHPKGWRNMFFQMLYHVGWVLTIVHVAAGAAALSAVSPADN